MPPRGRRCSTTTCVRGRRGISTATWGKTPTRRMAVGLVQFRVRVDVGDHVGSATLLLNAEYVLDPLDTVDCGSHRSSLCLVRRRRHLP